MRKRYKFCTDKPLTPDTLIALCVDRGMDMILGILAILKAGAAYVPIDPNTPNKRLHTILDDAQARSGLLHKQSNRTKSTKF